MQKLSLALSVLLFINATTLPTNEKRFTKLMNAIRTGNMNTFKKLYWQVNINHQDPNTGATPLLWAIIYDRRDMLVDILGRNPDITIPNYYGTTPLHAGIPNRDFDLFRHLLRLRANMYAQNHRGKKPWDLAQSDLPVRRIFMEYLEEHDPVAEEAEQQRIEINKHYEALDHKTNCRKRFNDYNDPAPKRQLIDLEKNSNNLPKMLPIRPNSWEAPPLPILSKRKSNPLPKVFRSTATTTGKSIARLRW